VSREGALRIAELRSLTKPVLRNAAQWLAESGEGAIHASDFDAGTLIIFGLCYALRPLAASEWPTGVSEIIRRLTEHLASQWASQAEEFHDKFVSGGFIGPMLAAAVLQAGDEAAEKLSEICRNEWRMAEASSAFAACPTLLWIGRRLLADMTDDAPDLLSCTWWSSEVSKLRSKYAISTSAIQQMVADVAAMSAYGRFQLPMPRRERDYLRHTLPFLTFYYLKEQDLDMVNPLLRALRYTGMTDIPEYRQAIEFVLGRSRIDGSFSMRDLATHLQSLNARPTINVRRVVHLPLTAASIWALVDCVFPESALGSGPHESE
jgi:hypothetical protein